MSLSETRPDRLIVVGNGKIVVVLAVEGVATVEINDGNVRLESNRLVIVGDSAVGQCQTNVNQTAKCAKRIASGCQLTPLGQRGEAVLLEDVAAAEAAIVVKVIVDVDGGEFLQGLDVPDIITASRMIAGELLK